MPLPCRSFMPLFRDGQFYLALLVAPLVLTVLAWATPSLFVGLRPEEVTVRMLVLWQPVVEEILFRGFIQGSLEKTGAGRTHLAGVTTANVVTSLLFAFAHLFNQAPVWAMLVFFPSLIFGYFRSRHESIIAPVLLHIAYNGFYSLFLEVI